MSETHSMDEQPRKLPSAHVSYSQTQPQHAHHTSQYYAPPLSPAPKSNAFKLVRAFLSLTLLIASIAFYVYINDLDSWSVRNLLFLLSSITSFLISLLFFGLQFRSSTSTSSVSFLAPAVLDIILGTTLFVATVMITAMYGDFNYYGFCSARVFVYSYNYYINCRGLLVAICMGFLSVILMLVCAILGVSKGVKAKKQQ